MLPQGLSQQEAARRLAADGPNELPAAGRRSAFNIVFEILREPMFGLLLGAVPFTWCWVTYWAASYFWSLPTSPSRSR